MGLEIITDNHYPNTDKCLDCNNIIKYNLMRKKIIKEKCKEYPRCITCMNMEFPGCYCLSCHYLTRIIEMNEYNVCIICNSSANTIELYRCYYCDERVAVIDDDIFTVHDDSLIHKNICPQSENNIHMI